MRINYIRHGVLFIFFVLLQGLLLKGLVLFETAFLFLYLYYLLGLNLDIEPIPAILIGFFMGLAVDIFYNTGAIHASASVMMMYFRGKWLNLITPQGGYEVGSKPNISLNGLQWYIGYIFPLLLIHHLTLFLLEALDLSIIWLSLKNAIFSVFLTSFVIILLQYIVRGRRGKR